MERGMTVLADVLHNYVRNFVPKLFDFTQWQEIIPFFQQLEDRRLDTAEQLESWLLDRSELIDVIQEVGSVLYIRMTCDTENKDLEQAYFRYLEEIAENVKSCDQRVKIKFLQSPAREQLCEKRYSVLLRSFQNDVDLFREENLRLETEESKLSQSYQKLMGSLMIQFEGKEQTLQQMSRYQELP